MKAGEAGEILACTESFQIVRLLKVVSKRIAWERGSPSSVNKSRCVKEKSNVWALISLCDEEKNVGTVSDERNKLLGEKAYVVAPFCQKQVFFLAPLVLGSRNRVCESLMGSLHERGGRPFRQTRSTFVSGQLGRIFAACQFQLAVVIPLHQNIIFRAATLRLPQIVQYYPLFIAKL